MPGADEIDDAPRQMGVRRHLSRSLEYDHSGNLQKMTDSGEIKDPDSPSGVNGDLTTITRFSSTDPVDPHFSPASVTCRSDWQCPPAYVSVWQPTPTLTDSDQATLLRKSHFTYNSTTTDLQTVESWLITSPPLARYDSISSASVDLHPPGQSSEGWRKSASFLYDLWGNMVQRESGQTLNGSAPTCTSIVYDDPYQELPVTVSAFKNGCGSEALVTHYTFDRGFAQIVSSKAPNGYSSNVDLDEYGRAKVVYLPDPDAITATIDYVDRAPLSYVDVKRFTGLGTTARSVTILNGLTEPVVTFDQGESNDWIVNGWQETNSSGQTTEVRRPFASSNDPTILALYATPIPIPPDDSYFEASYDDFGRNSSVREVESFYSNKELLRKKYFPLAIETRDAEQLKTGPTRRHSSEMSSTGVVAGLAPLNTSKTPAPIILSLQSNMTQPVHPVTLLELTRVVPISAL